MKRLRVVAVSFAAVVALSGCSLLDTGTNEKAASAAGIPTADATAAGAVQPTTAATANSGLGSVKDEGAIPDPCTVLSKTEVTDLTGRAITQVDQDGAQPGDTTRFCQWQQDSGQLALFLSRTTEDDFKLVIDGSSPVDGVGEDAFQLAGHLYVLYGTVQIDVYSRGGSDEKNLSDEIDVAKLVMSRI